MLQANVDQPVGRLQWAHYQLSRGDPAGAMKDLSTALQWDPSSAAMRQEMAVLHSVSGNPSEAVKQLREAVRLAPREAEYRYLLGLALHETGDLPAAALALAEAVQLDPSHAAAWYNLGLAQHAAKEPDAALQSLQRGEAAAPDDPRIPYARATVLMQLNRRAEALDAARRALDARPGFEPARQLIAQLNAARP
jgi:Flp pilus assembly protein TadD